MRKLSQVVPAVIVAGVLSVGGIVAWNAGDDSNEGNVSPIPVSTPPVSATPAPSSSLVVSPEASVSPSPAVSSMPGVSPTPLPSKRPVGQERADDSAPAPVAPSNDGRKGGGEQDSAPVKQEKPQGGKKGSKSSNSKKSPVKKGSEKPSKKKVKNSKKKQKSNTKKKSSPKKNSGKSKSSTASRGSKYAGKMTANFVFAHNSTKQNASMIRSMGADPVTFGYRVKPARKGDYPKRVQKAIGSKRVFSYATGIQWVSGLSRGDKKVDGFTVVNVGHNAVVVVRSDIDPQRRLVEAGKQTGARVFLGMPAPQQKSYLPDLSYKGVLDNFVRKYVKNYRAVGATGYYHHIEMPISGGSGWNGTRGLYASHNRIIAREHPGATAIIAPYLETRRAKRGASPAQSAHGAKLLMRTANGARLFIAPQDGLGTDTTALRVDRSRRHVGTTEDHFRAMRSAVGNKLWSTTEVMRPGSGRVRKSTSAHRVGQQLSAVRPYTQGSIGFMWNNDTGMRSVSGLSKYTVGSGKSF